MAQEPGAAAPLDTGSIEAVAAMLSPELPKDDEAAIQPVPSQNDAPRANDAPPQDDPDGTDAAQEGHDQEPTPGDDEAAAAAEAAASGGTDEDREDTFSDIFAQSLDGVDEEDVPDGAEPTQGDDLIEVKVDGQVEQVPLSKLIRSYTLGGATEKRLQEATEARTTAMEAARAEALPQIQQELTAASQERQRLAQIVSYYGEQLFAPRVTQPNPAQQDTDPIGYLQHVEAYRQDQDRVTQERAQAQQMVQTAQQDHQKQVAEYAATQRTQLQAAIPALKDPKIAKQFQAAITKTALAAGFSEQEIGSTLDARMLLIASKAAAYDDLMAKTQKSGKRLKGGKRTLTPGARVKQSGVSKKATDAARTRAQKTGRPEDVAALL